MFNVYEKYCVRPTNTSDVLEPGLGNSVDSYSYSYSRVKCFFLNPTLE